MGNNPFEGINVADIESKARRLQAVEMARMTSNAFKYIGKKIKKFVVALSDFVSTVQKYNDEANRPVNYNTKDKIF